MAKGGVVCVDATDLFSGEVLFASRLERCHGCIWM